MSDVKVLTRDGRETIPEATFVIRPTTGSLHVIQRSGQSKLYAGHYWLTVEGRENRSS